MKNQQNKKRQEQNYSAIDVTATLCEYPMLKNLVEKLALRGVDLEYSHEKVQPGWAAIDNSSIEAYVSGVFNFSSPVDSVKMTFVTNFLYTCVKTKEAEFKLAWGMSLS